MTVYVVSTFQKTERVIDSVWSKYAHAEMRADQLAEKVFSQMIKPSDWSTHITTQSLDYMSMLEI